MLKYTGQVSILRCVMFLKKLTCDQETCRDVRTNQQSPDHKWEENYQRSDCQMTSHDTSQHGYRPGV